MLFIDAQPRVTGRIHQECRVDPSDPPAPSGNPRWLGHAVEEYGSARDCSFLAKHGIESVAVYVPAGAMRVGNKVLHKWRTRSPRRHDSRSLHRIHG